jgi:hypothetical protein
MRRIQKAEKLQRELDYLKAQIALWDQFVAEKKSRQMLLNHGEKSSKLDLLKKQVKARKMSR